VVFAVIEGFSGTGKTTLATALEDLGWLRIAESAHLVQKEVPVADRADTLADYSLVGATMACSAVISGSRASRNIVAEGYFLSDLAYARIRFDLGKSAAFPTLFDLVEKVLSEKALQPDVYLLLKARSDTISKRQQNKGDREKNLSEFFQTRYYSAIEEIHEKLGQTNVETVESDTDRGETLANLLAVLKKRHLLGTEP